MDQKKEPRMVQERKQQHGLTHSIHAAAQAVFCLAGSGNTAIAVAHLLAGAAAERRQQEGPLDNA
jgi:hypothetical protein